MPHHHIKPAQFELFALGMQNSKMSTADEINGRDRLLNTDGTLLRNQREDDS